MKILVANFEPKKLTWKTRFKFIYCMFFGKNFDYKINFESAQKSVDRLEKLELLS